MLEISRLSASYKTQQVLKDISFNVGKQEIIAIIGPSGVGKSTLLNCITGLHSHNQGSIVLNQQAISAQKQIIGWIPQQYGLLPWKTVYENVVLNLKIKKIPFTTQQQEKIKEIMQQLDIYDLRKAFPNRLSGGQQQRVAIARAFVLESDLLLMDEPFSALDTFTREQTQQLFLNQWQQAPVPTILITHDIEEAAFLGTKILVLKGQPGECSHLYLSPQAAEKRLSNDYYQLIQTLRKELKH